METSVKGITSRKKNYSRWYLDVIEAAQLSSNSPVRGCMVIRPNGYAIWENIQKNLDRLLKERGVVNAYFPIFIPKSFFELEAEHVKGFATESAIVTHRRLKKNEESGKLELDGKLEEPLVIRPTSETIMYHMYSQWIQSYRDLPILINQWGNVVRWEMKPRPFIRTSEFLWQEGHTAHATKKEADIETLHMIRFYKKFMEEYLAVPSIIGYKSESEKFAGAVYTTTIESMMQDGKALQVGTSHMLGQNFSNDKVFNVSFIDENGQEQFVWQTSWGMSTRTIGAMVMVHSDDTGLIIPPKIAPIQVVIIPIQAGKDKESSARKADEVADILRVAGYAVKVDNRDERPGMKYFEWERKGVPIRIEIGPKDMAKQSVVAVRRDTGEKTTITEVDLVQDIRNLLDSIQDNLLARATAFCEARTHNVDSYDDFKRILKSRNGFLKAHWCGSEECESNIKQETTASTRCFPLDQSEEAGSCIYCGKPSNKRIIFAKAY